MPASTKSHHRNAQFRFLPSFLFMAFFWCSTAHLAFAEYPAIKEAIQKTTINLAEQLETQSVVVSVRDLSRQQWNWNVPEAIESELVASLRKLKINALDADAILQLGFLSNPKRLDIRKWQKHEHADLLLDGALRIRGKKAYLYLQLFDKKQKKPIRKTEVVFQPNDLELNGNIPKLNLDVLEKAKEFAKTDLGQDSWRFVEKIRKDLGARRFGFYAWGRELTPGETLLPGDLIHFNEARFNGRRRILFNLKSGVITELLPGNEVTVVIQESGRPKMHKVELDKLQSGKIAIYRPTQTANTELPLRVRPFRNQTVKKLNSSTWQEMLPLLKPDLDSVFGLWDFNSKGELISHRDLNTLIQVPVDLPKQYAVKVKVRRLDGGDAFGFVLPFKGQMIGLFVGGAKNTFTGLGYINDKPPRDNPTTVKKGFLAPNRTLEILALVEPDSIKVNIDGKEQISWKPGKQKISLPPPLKTSNQKWLHLMSHRSRFAVESLEIFTK